MLSTATSAFQVSLQFKFISWHFLFFFYCVLLPSSPRGVRWPHILSWWCSVRWSLVQGGTGSRAKLSRVVSTGHLGLPGVEPRDRGWGFSSFSSAVTCVLAAVLSSAFGGSSLLWMIRHEPKPPSAPSVVSSVGYMADIRTQVSQLWVRGRSAPLRASELRQLR